MKQSKKILIFGLILFVLLTGLAALLLSTIAVGNAEAAKRIAEVWGMATGIIIPAFSIWWFVERRKE